MEIAAGSKLQRIGHALFVSGVAFVVGTSCAAEVPGQPIRVESDLSKLDVGNYQTKPRELGNAKNSKQARTRESQRLADFVALPFEADPTYTEDAVYPTTPHVVLNRKSLGDLVINDTFDDVAKDLTAGWMDRWSTAAGPDDKRRTLSIAVLEFPDAATASSVGPTLEHDDFTYNVENEAVQLPKYPNTKAHWRPGVSSIGSWTTQDRFVVFIKVVDELSEPDRSSLIAHTERMLDKQLPLLAEFQPTPSEQLAKIPLDPAGLLGRTLPTNPEFRIRADPDGVYTARGARHGLEATNLEFLKTGDIDQVAYGDGAVFRSRTGAGARALWEDWRSDDASNPDHQSVEPPKGLEADIKCWADVKSNGDTGMHGCKFRVDRYNVQVVSRNVQDLYQKASAQYALLTSR